MKPLITYDDFSKMDLRVGRVVECIRKEGSEKLLRLTVDFGDEGKKTIFTALYPLYEPEHLKGKDFIFILNLEPRKMMDEESQGMLLCADAEIPIPLVPQSAATAGLKIT